MVYTHLTDDTHHDHSAITEATLEPASQSAKTSKLLSSNSEYRHFLLHILIVKK
jgi:hypothetical protein